MPKYVNYVAMMLFIGVNGILIASNVLSVGEMNRVGLY